MTRKDGSPKATAHEINLGLAIAGALLKPGEILTCHDIAAFTGTSKQQVQQMEAKALRSLRKAIEKHGIHSNPIR